MCAMRRAALLLTACLLLLYPGSAWASVPADGTGTPGAPVELVEPRPGSALPGGGVAVLAWEPRPGLDLEALGFVEWEAFLSLDGGERYAVRLTPHLDLALRRFWFEVPPVAAGDVRLMLRFGDEETERGYAVPGRFSIAPSSSSTSLGLPGVAPGEAARPGEPGVVWWVEGTRRGRDLSRRTALPAPSGATPLRWAAAVSRPACLVPRTLGGEPAAPGRSTAPPDRPQRLLPASSGPTPADLLLATGRRNE